MKNLTTMPLLLLLLVWISRKSSANPVAQQDVSSKSDTINGMINGTELLTDVFKWLDDNIKSSKFDQTLIDLENAVYSLPTDLGIDRPQIFESISKAKDRIIVTRVVLEEAANKLKGYCDELIQIYDDNEVTLELVQYTAEKFIRYSNRVLIILEDALQGMAEIGDELSRTKSLLQELSSSLVEKEQEIKDLEKKEREIKQKIYELKSKIEQIRQNQKDRNDDLDDIRLGVAIGTLGIGAIFSEPVIAIIKSEEEKDAENEILTHEVSIRDVQYKLAQNKEKLVKLRVAVTNAQSTALTLTQEVVGMKTYVTEEISLINQWKYSLAAAKDDQQNITLGDIKFGIKGIKSRLNDLIKACDDYINHKI